MSRGFGRFDVDGDRPSQVPMPPPASRLLLDDDDVSAIRLMSGMLTRYPDQRFTTSGPQALALALAPPPDVIVLDDEMPSRWSSSPGPNWPTEQRCAWRGLTR
ncbi:MAG: hypothetical protein ABIY55_22555 [Kofleriaceae bacterium]